MKNMKIRVKLITGFAVAIALAIVIGVVGIVSLTTAASNTALLNDRTTIAILSGRLAENVQEQRAAYRGAAAYSLMDMGDKEAECLAELTQLDKDFKTLMTEISALIQTPETQRMLDTVETEYQNYVAERDGFVATVTAPELDERLMAEELAQMLTPVTALTDDVDALTQYMSDTTDEQAAQAASDATRSTVIMIVVIVVAAGVSIALGLYIATLISKPLNLMRDYLVRVGTRGDLNFTPDEVAAAKKEAEARDEVGQSMAAFTGMMDRLIYIGNNLTAVANGDLTADITLLSEQDTMGNALATMNRNLNEMFADINSVSQQVSTASSEIATGAQSLAQGSTEQASTVEEISASINEITEQANTSVATANAAADESRSIRGIAQDGNEKMGRLSSAVQEMSEASQSIGNVIKVIDDIAFQTNILALNAAVEAARAGEHGKGFAVVADEVRNLAGKSAEAAKETAGLISANIEKSEMGLAISQETAETLRQIVEGVERTTESLSQIAQQSEGSKTATEQVNLAVDQVAQVVQQNSATSEESAAASEEMSSQAQMLQQLIARFKLKDSAPQLGAASAPYQLPQAAPAAYDTGSSSGVIF